MGISEHRLAQIEKLYAELRGETEEEYKARIARLEKQLKEDRSRDRKGNNSSKQSMTHAEFVEAMPPPLSWARLRLMKNDEMERYDLERWKLHREEQRLWDDQLAVRTRKDNALLAIKLRNAPLSEIREVMRLMEYYQHDATLPAFLHQLHDEREKAENLKKVALTATDVTVEVPQTAEKDVSFQVDSFDRDSKKSHATSKNNFAILARKRIVPKDAARHRNFRRNGEAQLSGISSLPCRRSTEPRSRAEGRGDMHLIGGAGLEVLQSVLRPQSDAWTPPRPPQVALGSKWLESRESSLNFRRQRRKVSPRRTTPYRTRTRAGAHKGAFLMPPRRGLRHGLRGVVA